ncbi:MAG: PAS domain-containing sensor histidine kinase [Bacteroidia bacterium]
MAVFKMWDNSTEGIKAYNKLTTQTYVKLEILNRIVDHSILNQFTFITYTNEGISLKAALQQIAQRNEANNLQIKQLTHLLQNPNSLLILEHLQQARLINTKARQFLLLNEGAKSDSKLYKHEKLNQIEAFKSFIGLVTLLQESITLHSKQEIQTLNQHVLHERNKIYYIYGGTLFVLAILGIAIFAATRNIKRITKDTISSNLQLKESLQLVNNYKDALDASSVVSITDPKGIILYVNDRFCEESKYTREELVGKNHRILNSGYHPKSFFKELWDTVKAGNIWTGEVRNKAKDGEIYWTNATIVPLMDELNHPFQFLVIRSNITKRKEAEIKIIENDLKYRRTLDNLMEGAQIMSFDWTYLYINNAAARFGKYSVNELLGSNMFKMYPGIELTDTYFALEKSMNQRIPQFITTQFEFPNGETGWFDLSIQPVPEGIFILSEDITKRKESEQELIRNNEKLRKANMELDRFVYSTSHDLRAPLSSMLGLVQLLEIECQEAGFEQNEKLQMMKTSITRLDEFIETILQYSRNARIEPVMEEILLQKLVDETLAFLQITAYAADISVSFDIKQDAPFFSDKYRLTTMLKNIISNAIKYADLEKVKPKIQIQVDVNDTQAQIHIQDNGIGIEPDEQEKIFEMFYRATNKATGSGLGLYIVKEMLNLLDGKIEVESKPMFGSRFSIILPNAQNAN